MSDLVLFLGQAVVVTAAIAALVTGLSLFFRWLPRPGPRLPGIRVNDVTDLFENERVYDVLLSSGHRLEALRFEGIVQADAEAVWSLRQLVVMRRADGGKVILRIDAVRVFEEVARP